MLYEAKGIEFGKLAIGAMFEYPKSVYWFKRSKSTGVGTKPTQGPHGRNWDRFSKDLIVTGEVKQ